MITLTLANATTLASTTSTAAWSWPLDGWIVATGALCAVATALPGCFLLLRRMSLMGDAVSHAVLPGLAAAFLITGSRSSVTMFAGAVVVGLLTAWLTEWLRGRARVEASASLGIVFTALFALGLVLIVRAADRVDLDPGCVLYGAIELTPADRVSIGGVGIPRAALVLAVVGAFNLACVLLFRKELAASAFDPEFAEAQGISARGMHYLLMTMTAVTAVAAFESVGSILVVALLTVPAATAFVLTKRLGAMLVVACAAGVLSAVLGHLAAIRLPALVGAGSVNTAGMMAVMAGAILVAALVGAAIRARFHSGRTGGELVADLAQDGQMRPAP